ncbi:putative feruloyl esterase [Alternaria arborescens]|uniref:putative feruloyl esterase n=1 Tax=Alternaria arborescens TaxID=156630 RepID=UPI001074AACD|nr:putative feruloyl esterase [Alternaria arborescens]RYN42692.1 putative feruloyl esterase [Alternaria arborescens]RYO36319.1 putative feruloyl esterase [Alternaria arborescens]
MYSALATRVLACSSLQQPYLPGTAVTNFTAELKTQWTPAGSPIPSEQLVPLLGFSSYNISYCRVEMTYNHPGQNDTINLQVWLPEEWNGRFQGVGGGGWRAGVFDQLLLPAIIDGYAAASTDGGHNATEITATPWALRSPGNVDLAALQNFGSVTLNELSIFGKMITESFYEKAPTYSYWLGCSQGGRQGMMLAQRYPEAFDGILAAAPALNINPLFASLFHAQAVMNTLEEYPPNCEFEAITAAAIAACDALDGFEDSIISIPELCSFDPFTVVGQPVNCSNNSSDMISEAAATVANAAWYGVSNKQGQRIYPGYSLDAPLKATVDTACRSSGNCSISPWALGAQFYQLFVEKNTTFDVSTITAEILPDYMHAGYQQWESFIGTNDADLTAFKEAGGKLLSWHGIADDLIPFGGSTQYYNRVAALDDDVDHYYKLFVAPGVYHCGGGPGAQPIQFGLQQLVSWVENGTSPDTIPAIGKHPVNGTVLSRDLCPYPLVSVYQGGAVSDASSYRCVDVNNA